MRNLSNSADVRDFLLMIMKLSLCLYKRDPYFEQPEDFLTNKNASSWFTVENDIKRKMDLSEDVIQYMNVKETFTSVQLSTESDEKGRQEAELLPLLGSMIDSFRKLEDTAFKRIFNDLMMHLRKA